MPVRRSLLLLALPALAACGSAQAASTGERTASTVGGVGILPGAVATPSPEVLMAATTSATTAATTTTTTGATTTATGAASTSVAPVAALKATSPAGERAAGNRVLMIGDSVMAGTSSRYSNDMCKAVVPLGWQVEVDAEVGRFVDFADQVLDKRLSAGWDAAVIFLGSNYGDNQPVFASLLEEQVERLSPRPVVLVTVTEFKSTRTEVNAAIKMIAFNHPNVSIVDWATISRDTPGVLSGDDLHPSPAGRQVLAQAVADALGTAPAQPGSCIKSTFRDDSAGSVVTGTTAPRNPTTTVRRRTTPTTKPDETTTPKTTPKPTPTTSPTATTAKPTPTTDDPPTTPKPTTVTTPKPTDPPTPKPPTTTDPPATSGP